VSDKIAAEQEYKKAAGAPWSEPFPVFAERVYAIPEVKDWCISLQNEYYVNVNILLWTFWLQEEKIKISSFWLEDVLIAIDTTSQVTVGRLRDVRRAIKASTSFTRVQSQLVCRHILNAEISAERIFLQRLQDLTSKFLESTSPYQQDAGQQDSGTAKLGAADDELDLITPEHYLDFLGVSDTFTPVSEIHLYSMQERIKQV